MPAPEMSLGLERGRIALSHQEHQHDSSGFACGSARKWPMCSTIQVSRFRVSLEVGVAGFGQITSLQTALKELGLGRFN